VTPEVLLPPPTLYSAHAPDAANSPFLWAPAPQAAAAMAAAPAAAYAGSALSTRLPGAGSSGSQQFVLSGVGGGGGGGGGSLSISGSLGGGYPARAHVAQLGFAPVTNLNDNPPCNTLFIGNLCDEVDERDLRAVMEPQPGFK
jgi:hypothetical protein